MRHPWKVARIVEINRALSIRTRNARAGTPARQVKPGYHAGVDNDGILPLRIALLVQRAPLATGAARTALAFARAAVARGHDVWRVFFYKEAVVIGNRFADDETAIRDEWSRFGATHGVELVLCVSAARRRGVVEGESLAPGFATAGLGVLVETMTASARLVSF